MSIKWKKNLMKLPINISRSTSEHDHKRIKTGDEHESQQNIE